MSESENEEALTLPKGEKEPLRLGLKTGKDAGPIRPAGAGPRGRSVQVEVRRKRTISRGVPADAPETADTESTPAVVTPVQQKIDETERDAVKNLSSVEKAARARALAEAEEVEAARVIEEEAAELRRVEEAAREQAETALEAERQAEDNAGHQIDGGSEADPGAVVAAVEEQLSPADIEAAAKQAESRGKAAPTREPSTRQLELDGGAAGNRAGRNRGPAAARRGGDQRRRGKRLTVSQALSGDDERMRSLASMRRQRARSRQSNQSAEPPVKVVRDVIIPETISVSDLANRMAERSVDVVKTLIGMGVMANVNQVIDTDAAELVVTEMGHRPQRVSEADVEIGIGGHQDIEEDLLPRPPVVTVMGHVDHGKTSLLDALRETDVVAGEAGGITQHIGAYQIELDAGRITFIDTPGHAAFTEMRKRGASVTDIVILVVAADDGVMPQTIEAIHHAQAAEVPIVVAINKIDRPDANPGRVKQELLQHEVVSEDFGGDVQMVEVSALEKTNLDGLLESVMLQAEILELKANPDRAAEGIVIEARLDRGRGPVATVLVQKGNLCNGDIFVAGSEYGRVRALIDSHSEPTDAAGPSVPVEVLGLNGTPRAGDPFAVVESEVRAREVSEYRQRMDRDKRVVAAGTTSLEQLFARIQEGEAQEFPIVLKTDVQGSMEAIVGAAENLKTDEVAVNILHAGVGGITESDVTLAGASDGLVIGFNVRANAQARDLARRDGVDIRYYSIIYELVDELKSVLSGMLAPRIDETIVANAEILEVFTVSKVGRIAGCRVIEGTAKRDAFIRVLRDDIVIHDGRMSSLKRFKDDAREVREGNECGIGVEGYSDLRPGDIFEIYEKQEFQRTL